MRRSVIGPVGLGLGTLAIGFACASGPIESYRSKYDGSPPLVDALLLRDTFVVPPDRALVSMHVVVEATTAAGSSVEARAVVDRLRGALPAPCVTSIVDYHPPKPVDSDEHVTVTDLIVDIPLTDTDSRGSGGSPRNFVGLAMFGVV